MTLHLLLDENISQAVADQVQKHRPNITIYSVHTWHDGVFRGCRDSELLLAASLEQLTLVTYDLKTIPSLLQELYHAGQSHTGVVFVDDFTIANDAFGTLPRAIISFWEQYANQDWTDCVHFLEKQS